MLVTEMERAVARQTSSKERNCIIVMLGEAKKACFSDYIGAAYQGASKCLQLANNASQR